MFSDSFSVLHAENAKVFHGFPLKKPREVMAKTGKASKAEGASEVCRAAAVFKVPTKRRSDIELVYL